MKYLKDYINLISGIVLSMIVYLMFAFFGKTLFPENSLVFNATTLMYFLASFVYLVHWIFKWEKGGVVGSSLAWCGFFLNLKGFLLRWLQTHQAGFGYVPLSNLYESLVFFGLCIAGIYLFLELRLSTKILGGLVFIVATLVMAYASLKADASIKPLLPALKSNWLIAHVITCFLGYGAFAIAFGLGIFYLINERKRNEHSLFSKTILENLIYRLILFGFFWFSLGIITGAVWANQAWGSYWSWDPKETWSLITWLVYGGTLHAKIVRGWNGKRFAWLAVIGFISVLFTYFGVNFFLTGLHSYATPN